MASPADVRSLWRRRVWGSAIGPNIAAGRTPAAQGWTPLGMRMCSRREVIGFPQWYRPSPPNKIDIYQTLNGKWERVFVFPPVENGILMLVAQPSLTTIFEKSKAVHTSCVIHYMTLWPEKSAFDHDKCSCPACSCTFHVAELVEVCWKARWMLSPMNQPYERRLGVGTLWLNIHLFHLMALQPMLPRWIWEKIWKHAWNQQNQYLGFS